MVSFLLNKNSVMYHFIFNAINYGVYFFILILERIFAYSGFEIYKIWGGEVLLFILEIP